MTSNPHRLGAIMAWLRLMSWAGECTFMSAMSASSFSVLGARPTRTGPSRSACSPVDEMRTGRPRGAGSSSHDSSFVLPNSSATSSSVGTVDPCSSEESPVTSDSGDGEESMDRAGIGASRSLSSVEGRGVRWVPVDVDAPSERPAGGSSSRIWSAWSKKASAPLDGWRPAAPV